MPIVSSTEFQNNVGKYLKIVQEGGDGGCYYYEIWKGNS